MHHLPCARREQALAGLVGVPGRAFRRLFAKDEPERREIRRPAARIDPADEVRITRDCRAKVALLVEEGLIDAASRDDIYAGLVEVEFAKLGDS